MPAAAKKLFGSLMEFPSSHVALGWAKIRCLKCYYLGRVMLCHLEGGKGLTNAAHEGACGGVKLLAQPQERKSELRAP